MRARWEPIVGPPSKVELVCLYTPVTKLGIWLPVLHKVRFNFPQVLCSYKQILARSSFSFIFWQGRLGPPKIIFSNSSAHLKLLLCSKKYFSVFICIINLFPPIFFPGKCKQWIFTNPGKSCAKDVVQSNKALARRLYRVWTACSPFICLSSISDLLKPFFLIDFYFSFPDSVHFAE